MTLCLFCSFFLIFVLFQNSFLIKDQVNYKIKIKIKNKKMDQSNLMANQIGLQFFDPFKCESKWTKLV